MPGILSWDWPATIPASVAMAPTSTITISTCFTMTSRMMGWDLNLIG